jgi:hypothetical protein
MSRDSETPFFKAHLREAYTIKKYQSGQQINASLGRIEQITMRKRKTLSFDPPEDKL